MKKLISFMLVLAMLFCIAPVYTSAAESAYATILTASDFQGDIAAAVERLGTISSRAKADGLTADAAIFGGDYSNTVGIGPDSVCNSIKSTVTSVFTGINSKNILFVQGNHDLNGVTTTASGLHDFGSFLVYSLNEDDFYRPQYSLTYGAQGIKKLAAGVKTQLNTLIEKGETRPVFFVTHIPLHHSSRNSYGDVLYSKYLFDVLNKAAKSLDIIYLFGHNHSGNFDDYIGGSVNFLAKGKTIRIPIPSNDSRGATGYTKQTLNFTYMNYGYVGYSNNGTTDGSVNVLTASFIQIKPSKITVIKYTQSGKYSTKNITRINAGTTTATLNTDSVKKTLTSDTYTSGVTKLVSGNNYIISYIGEGEVAAAKAENKVTGDVSYLGLKDEAVNEDENSSGTYSITTTDKSIVYTAEKINGNMYLKSKETGYYLSIKKYDADSTYSRGRLNIELVNDYELDDNAVCTVQNGVLKIGGYYLTHSSNWYYCADESAASVVLFAGKKTTSLPCSHICHRTDNISKFIWNMEKAIFELFGVEKKCSCGVKHY